MQELKQAGTDTTKTDTSVAPVSDHLDDSGPPPTTEKTTSSGDTSAFSRALGDAHAEAERPLRESAQQECRSAGIPTEAPARVRVALGVVQQRLADPSVPDSEKASTRRAVRLPPLLAPLLEAGEASLTGLFEAGVVGKDGGVKGAIRIWQQALDALRSQEGLLRELAVRGGGAELASVVDRAEALEHACLSQKVSTQLEPGIQESIRRTLEGMEKRKLPPGEQRRRLESAGIPARLFPLLQQPRVDIFQAALAGVIPPGASPGEQVTRWRELLNILRSRAVSIEMLARELAPRAA